MGPATLLCPPGTLQVFGQVAPSKVTCQKGLLPSSDNVKHLVYAHWTRSFLRPSPLFFPSMPLPIGRRDIAPSCWRALSAAAGGDVLVEETVAAEDANATPEEPTSSEDASSTSAPKRQVRRIQPKSSRNATVSVDDLVPGAVFTGKVTTIQSFGAFVDFGAFTNGLAHISRLSKSYVKKVEDVVQVGQEVSVKILDVDLKSNRISLMLEGAEGEEATDDGKQSMPQLQQPTRAPRRRKPATQTAEPTTKLKKGEIVTGVVKNIIRSGVFLSLPDGIDGYLPALEVVFQGPSTNLESEFQVGQEVSVRVLRVDKGRVTLSTKKEVDFDKINEALNKGLEGGATNPFEIAFRQSDVIGSFLAEREKQKNQEDNEVKEVVEGEQPAAEVIEVVGEEKPPVETEDAATAASEAVLETDKGEEPNAVDVEEAKEDTEKDKSEVGTEEAAGNAVTSEAVLELEEAGDGDQAKGDVVKEKPVAETEEAPPVTSETVSELPESEEPEEQHAGEDIVAGNPVVAVAETGEIASSRSEADIGSGQDPDEVKEVAGDESPGVEAQEVPVATSL